MITHPFTPAYTCFVDVRKSQAYAFCRFNLRRNTIPADPEDLFRQIRNDLDSIQRRLPELGLRIMELKGESQAKEERIWELEQVADPDHDGHPLCERWNQSNVEGENNEKG